MSITTRSAFYYGFTITALNSSIDFNEGGSELQATLNNGDYTLEEFLAEVQRALNAAGALTYSVSVNRTTRIMTISATGTFSLLAGTGTRIGTGAWSLMGWAAANDTGANTYNGDTGAGFEYLPQVKFYGYRPSAHHVEKNDAVVNEASSGLIQVVQFGTRRFIECEIRMNVNNGAISACQPSIESNATGLDDTIDFMEYAITKAKMEFMPDRGSRSTFQKVLLESTEAAKNGTAFRLMEVKSGPGYWETGRLVFRVVT